jgi:N-acetylmuramoyl-L-alanine amidase
MPSALVEVGFMSNKNELAIMMTDEFKNQVAQGLLQGIVDYLSGMTN